MQISLLSLTFELFVPEGPTVTGLRIISLPSKLVLPTVTVATLSEVQPKSWSTS